MPQVSATVAAKLGRSAHFPVRASGDEAVGHEVLGGVGLTAPQLVQLKAVAEARDEFSALCWSSTDVTGNQRRRRLPHGWPCCELGLPPPS